MVGDAFMQGLRYRLPLPKVCRPFGAYNSHNLIPNSRSDGGGTFISGRASCGIHHLPVFCRTYSALFCVVRLPKALPWADILRSLLSAPHSELRFRAIVYVSSG